jgi:outer membrane lipopolysaccharide assembly protein LptE/RlpB
VKKLFFLILIALCGCGYTTRGFVYPSSKIFISPTLNKISVTGETQRYSTYTSYPILIENRFTNELINKFNIDGHLKVVSLEEDALKLTSEITQYTKEALRYTGSEDVDEQRLRLYVRIKLVDPDGKVIKIRDIVGETTFFLSGPNAVSETQAQQTLIEDTARRALEAVIEEWQI